MFAAKKRWGQDGNTVVKSKVRTFYAPTRWKDPARIFVCSWSDFFIEEADPWRDQAWQIMEELAPQHTYLILTKRPQRIRQCLPQHGLSWPWPHVWLGVSVEDQKMADERIPLLLNVEAAVKWVNVEPMLEFVNLRPYLGNYYAGWAGTTHGPVPIIRPGLGWVATGAESGPKRRPFEPAWAEAIYEECYAAGVPFYGKQDSALYPGKPLLIGGREIHEWPEVP